ncbi:hypothetical protein Q428_14275, partial [Fervidicella metallireducens AeB]
NREYINWNKNRKDLIMQQINYNGESFQYRLIKKKKKNITIRITKNGEVVVTSPIYVDEKYICKLVESKAEWIIDKIKEMEKVKKQAKNIEYKSGSAIEYLGEKLILDIAEANVNKVSIYIDGNKLFIKLPKDKGNIFSQQILKTEISEWLKNQAKIILKERVEFLSEKNNLIPNRVVVKEQKTIWGSCSNKRNINLNWRLVMMPIEVIDYVVVHELCHLKHHNHSNNFWSLVKEIMPDYEVKKRWLKENGGRIMNI